MALDETLLQSLRQRYPDVHPLIFHRSAERAKSAGELFDILETVPIHYPLVWNDDWRQWVTTADVFQAQAFVDLKKISE